MIRNRAQMIETVRGAVKDAGTVGLVLIAVAGLALGLAIAALAIAATRKAPA